LNGGRAKDKEQRAESRKQRAESREQRRESREQRTENREQRTENRPAADEPLPDVYTPTGDTCKREKTARERKTGEMTTRGLQGCYLRLTNPCLTCTHPRATLARRHLRTETWPRKGPPREGR
jgi:hypothetical protein